jgi:hypothetical protein
LINDGFDKVSILGGRLGVKGILALNKSKALRKRYPDITWQLGSDAIASTILTVLECQFMQVMGTPEILEAHF